MDEVYFVIIQVYACTAAFTLINFYLQIVNRNLQIVNLLFLALATFNKITFTFKAGGGLCNAFENIHSNVCIHLDCSFLILLFYLLVSLRTTWSL